MELLQHGQVLSGELELPTVRARHSNPGRSTPIVYLVVLTGVYPILTSPTVYASSLPDNHRVTVIPRLRALILSQYTILSQVLDSGE